MQNLQTNSVRTKIDFRTSSKENYKDFCKKHPEITLSFEDWKKIIYQFTEDFKTYLLETGETGKLPWGFGEFRIKKKKRKKKVGLNQEFINLPIDWKKTKESGKRIYNFNFHTEGYFFGWHWIKSTARLKHLSLWYFKPCRATSRLLSHYLKVDNKYQHIYQE